MFWLWHVDKTKHTFWTRLHPNFRYMLCKIKQISTFIIVYYKTQINCLVMRLINCFTLISWSSAAGFHDTVVLFVSFLIRLTDYCHYFIVILYFSVQLAAFPRHIASQNPSHDSSVCHLLSLRLHYGRRRSSRRLRAFAYRCNTI